MRRTTTITPDLLRSWGADEDIARSFAGHSSMTPREVSGLDIPHEDLMWVLMHALWARDPWLCYDFALWCAEQALPHVAPEWQERARATLDVVRGLRGASAAGAARAARLAWAAGAVARQEAVWVVGAAARAAARVAEAARAASATVAAGVDVWAGGGAAWAAGAARVATIAGAGEAAQIARALDLLEAPTPELPDPATLARAADHIRGGS